MKRNCGFNVVESYDEKTDTTNEIDVSFKKGEIAEGDLEDDRGDSINFQFGDGSMLYGLKKNLYDVIEDD